MTAKPAPDLDDDRSSWMIIMGAAVRPGGEPSPALRRRVAGAVAAAQDVGGRVVFLPTGGVGRHGPAEATVMARLLLEAGVDPADIVAEEAAHDTLSSVENCTAMLRARAAGAPVYVATDGFHRLRCVWLFRLYGVPVHGVSVPSTRRPRDWPTWLYYCVREMAAVPWDVFLALWRRRRAGPAANPRFRG